MSRDIPKPLHLPETAPLVPPAGASSSGAQGAEEPQAQVNWADSTPWLRARSPRLQSHRRDRGQAGSARTEGHGPGASVGAFGTVRLHFARERSPGEGKPGAAARHRPPVERHPRNRAHTEGESRPHTASSAPGLNHEPVFVYGALRWFLSHVTRRVLGSNTYGLVPQDVSPSAEPVWSGHSSTGERLGWQGRGLFRTAQPLPWGGESTAREESK